MPAATGNVVIRDTNTRGFRDSGRTGLPVDQDYDVSTTQTVFTTSQVFVAGSTIDVWQNGRLMREGSGQDFTRTVGTTITFASSPPTGSWVRIRIWT